MIKFQEILENEAKIILRKDCYLEFWDNCIVKVLRYIHLRPNTKYFRLNYSFFL